MTGVREKQSPSCCSRRFAFAGRECAGKSRQRWRDQTPAVNATLDRFYRQIPGARETGLTGGRGCWCFPTILKAGMGFGGEYGEGAMRSGGRTVGYYNTIAASFGFQLGAQARSVIIMFHDPGGAGQLSSGRRVFKIGVDGSVAIIVVGRRRLHRHR